MRKEDFVATRGDLKEVETEKARAEAFVPPELPVEIDIDVELLKLADSARGNLGKLYSLSKELDNPTLYQSPALVKEAVSSARIEGTRTTMERVFEKEIKLSEKQIDAQERDLRDPEDVVASLKEGIDYGMSRIKHQPLNPELIKRLHDMIFSGADILSGEFRNDQVWIGPEGAGIEEAKYVPSPPGEIDRLVENLTDYLNEPEADDLPVLIKIAIGHYQFEAVHPFEDGNGRVGRLIVLLNMCDEDLGEELLAGPFINLSNYFLRNRSQYYDRLMRVSSEGEYVEWIKFFLRAVERQSQHALETLEEIKELRREYKNKVSGKGSPRITREVVDQLFRNPIITIPKVEEEFDVSYQTASNAVHALQDQSILEEKTPNQRPKKFICREVLDTVYSDFEWAI